MANTVRNQGLAIKEMSKSLNLKINKNEVELALSQKSGKTEMNKMAVELKNLIQQKASNEQINQLLNDKISKNEVLFYLSSKPSIDDIKNILEEKIGIREYEEIINEIDLLKKEKLNIYIFNSQIKEIKEIIDNKPNSIDVINALDTKVDKDELKNDLENKMDKKEIININNILNEKVNKTELDTINHILDNKLNKNELHKFENINNILNNKADNNDFNLINEAFQDMKIKITKRIDDIDNDLDRLIDNIKLQFQSLNDELNNLEKNKIDNSIIEQINEVINRKVDNNILEESISELKNNIYNSMNNFIEDLEVNQKKFEEKIIINLNTVSKENQSLLENINIQNETIKDLYENKNNSNNENEIHLEKIFEISKNIQIENNSQIENLKLEIKKDMENLLNIINKKMDTNAMNEYLLKIDNLINSKIDSSELQESQDKIIGDINNKIKELYEDITKELSDKITQKEVNLLLADKINIDKQAYEQKLSIKDFENFKNQNEDIKKELKQKLDINIFNKMVNQFNINFDNIKNDIKSKADTKEIYESLKNKINIEQINNFYNDINNKLNEKTNNNDFTTAIDNQAIINDTLCNENCIGRWVWRSGKIKSSYSVPWESQSINTSPDNFIWEKDKTYIMVNENGLYELNFGFYSDKKPNIQILVNGEIIINSQNNNNNNLLNNNYLTTRKINSKNVGGNITGLSVVEFIMLPSQSKLSVCYNGGIGTGFIGLKKL